MTTQIAMAADTTSTRTSEWSAVFALTLCVSTLIASEFMPVSLLTPIASELHVTEGRAGQSIAVSGIFAVVTSLLIAPTTRGIDRRKVLLSLTFLMGASGLIVALAPTFTVLMVGRALIGVVIGGFWSMSAATVMRLVPEDEVPRALALLNGGNALATTIAAPLGSFLGQYIGWRGAFFSVVPLAVVTFGWQFLTLPPMPSSRAPGALNVFRVLLRPRAPRGIAAVMLLFAGQFALFTYLRPFLETVTAVNVSTLSLLLLIVGGAGLVGTYLIGSLLKRHLQSLLIVMPLAMAALAVGFVGLGTSTPATAALLAGWGLIGTAAPVAWWTWLSRTMPGEAEAGGGLMVAAIQLAITAGAAVGGVLYDNGGYQSAFGMSAALLVGSALLAWTSSALQRPSSTPTLADRKQHGENMNIHRNGGRPFGKRPALTNLSALIVTLAFMGSAVAQQRILISSDWGNVTAELDDNAATRALMGMLPVSLEMRDHLRQEKTGYLPGPLPEIERKLDFSAGTLGLWNANHFVIYYRNGRVPRPGIIPLGRVTGDASIFDRPGQVTIRLER